MCDFRSKRNSATETLLTRKKEVGRQVVVSTSKMICQLVTYNSLSTAHYCSCCCCCCCWLTYLRV